MQVIFSQRKHAIIHLSVFLNGSEVAVKSEHKILGMYSILSSIFKAISGKLLLKPREIPESFSIYPSMYHGGVLDQIYELHVPPHLYYDEIIYHKYDPEFKLDFTKKLESIQYSAALAVTGAWSGV